MTGMLIVLAAGIAVLLGAGASDARRDRDREMVGSMESFLCQGTSCDIAPSVAED